MARKIFRNALRQLWQKFRKPEGSNYPRDMTSMEADVSKALPEIPVSSRTTEPLIVLGAQNSPTTCDRSSEGSSNTANNPNMINAEALAIIGGQFEMNKKKTVIQVTSPERVGFKILLEHTAADAFHNSSERGVDCPRCHDETRVQILKTIYEWITQSAEHRERWILWLNGAAGAGKSAIVQTTVEHCDSEKIAFGSFLFGRSEVKLDRIENLVATLAYQLILAIPGTEEGILSTIERDPLIFKRSLKLQLDELIVQPILKLPQNLQKQFTVVIDDLDECLDRTHQSNLIKVLGDITGGKNIPVVFLIASRREPHIVAEFRIDIIDALLQNIPLDDSEASDDIRRFLNDSFSNIKKNHLYSGDLPDDWPPISVVSEIVDKASSQFIFPSVVIKYVSSPHGNPARQLEDVRNLSLHSLTSTYPFARLDSLYRHIFSQIDKQTLDKVLDILAFYFITTHSDVEVLEGVFRLPPGELGVLLAGLSAVMHLKPIFINLSRPKRVTLLHASLPDFLQHRIRSGEYFCDLDERRIKLLSIFLDKSFPNGLTPPRIPSGGSEQQHWQLHVIRELLEKAKPYARLRSAIINFDITFEHVEGSHEFEYEDTISRIRILELIKKLSFGDQNEAYNHVLDVFAREHAVRWPLHGNNIKEEVRKCPDLCARVIQLRPEFVGHPSIEFNTSEGSPEPNRPAIIAALKEFVEELLSS